MSELTRIMALSPETLGLGARKHCEIATQSAEAVAECFRRDAWTCHVCGVRLPNYMEVDHPVGHRECPSNDMKTICQFCHNLKHPLWAATQGRLRMFWAPGLTQCRISRIAWQVLLASKDRNGKVGEGEIAEAARHVVNDTRRRERVLENVVGTANPGALIDALHTTKRLVRKDVYQETLKRACRIVRFWPVAADRIDREVELPSAAFSSWSAGRFVDLSPELVSWYRQHLASPDQLQEVFARYDSGSIS